MSRKLCLYNTFCIPTGSWNQLLPEILRCPFCSLFYLIHIDWFFHTFRDANQGLLAEVENLHGESSLLITRVTSERKMALVHFFSRKKYQWIQSAKKPWQYTYTQYESHFTQNIRENCNKKFPLLLRWPNYKKNFLKGSVSPPWDRPENGTVALRKS